MSITVNNLSKSYGSQKAVNNISFSVHKGEIVGFLGPNGAGKSTTMKIITGYLSPDAGQVSVCGVDISREIIESKTKIGYLPEANPLYTDMYVKEYLHFIANIHKVPNPANRIEEVINTVRLSTESHKKIGELSKGYKQRVGLAAALVHNPEVLILDEPTSGLDPNQIVEIRNVIKSLSVNKTILFSSHIMQEVEAICDRVIIINKGNIVANDTLADLRKSSGNQEIVSVQFKEDVPPAELSQLETVISVAKNDAQGYNLTCTNAETVKKQLLQLSIEKGLNIVSLQTYAHSLEEVFKSLTT